MACDETGSRIESVNAFRCVFCRKEAAFHSADLSPTLNSLDRRSVQRPPRRALTLAFQAFASLAMASSEFAMTLTTSSRVIRPALSASQENGEAVRVRFALQQHAIGLANELDIGELRAEQNRQHEFPHVLAIVRRRPVLALSLAPLLVSPVVRTPRIKPPARNRSNDPRTSLAEANLLSSFVKPTLSSSLFQ